MKNDFFKIIVIVIFLIHYGVMLSLADLTPSQRVTYYVVIESDLKLIRTLQCLWHGNKHFFNVIKLLITYTNVFKYVHLFFRFFILNKIK